MNACIQGAGRPIGYGEATWAKIKPQAEQAQKILQEPEPPRSEFGEAREHAYMALSSLSDVLAELERRLGPVLMVVPMPAGAALGNQQAQQELSEVAGALHSAARSAEAMRERVLALLHALAV